MWKIVQAALIVGLLVASWGCGPSDPRERVLERRTLWNVSLLSWAAAEDGSLMLSLRISGPARRELDRLTVRIEMLDAQGARVDEVWKTLDLSSIQRGGPEDVDIRLAPREASVEGIAINLVPRPDDEEARHIEELRI